MNPVVHFGVVGANAGALQRFYGEAFGWELAAVDPTYAMALPRAGAGINGGIGASFDGGAGHMTFYVEVERLEDALARIEQLGGATRFAPTDVPNGPRVAHFADPEGHVVGLIEAGTRRSR